jgi:NAD(P)H-dependent flavin oxidoreductase YrpB (nitropropane dioxygenase family)
MVGHPKHVTKALNVGVDIIIAQGGEGGGHTGATPTSILIPSCVDIARGKLSPLTGRQVPVVAAGGIFDGRGLAAALMWGAAGVWVGTRFVASVEAGAPPKHKELLVSAGMDDTSRTLIYSGRPMRVRRTPYVDEWENTRQKEITELCEQGIIPHELELERKPQRSMEGNKWLMGTAAGVINEVS